MQVLLLLVLMLFINLDLMVTDHIVEDRINEVERALNDLKFKKGTCFTKILNFSCY